jgi:hypothetical protein
LLLAFVDAAKCQCGAAYNPRTGQQRPRVMVALVAELGPSAALRADSDDATPVFHNIGTVTQPAIDAIKAGVTATNPTGKFASFDISWVDNGRNVYYLADRSNNAVDAIDARDGSFIRYLFQGLFVGVVAGTPNRNGPDGIVTDQHGNVWVGDGHPATGGTSSLKELNPKHWCVDQEHRHRRRRAVRRAGIRRRGRRSHPDRQPERD